MMTRSNSYFALGLLLGTFLATVLLLVWQDKGRDAESGAEGRTVLKLGHVLDQSHPVHAGMAFMAERLAEISGGTVTLEIYPNGQLGSEPECIEQVQRGALAMVKTSAAAMEGFVPEMAVFGLPYLFRDEAHYWNVLTGPIGQEMLRISEAVGGIGLCYYDSGSRSFYTARRPVLRPEDIRGLKLRVLPSRMAMDMVSTFGGAPTPIPWGELYTALQQGMVDGAENNPPSLLSSRHYEVARHYSLNEHTRIPDILLMSKAVWDRLPPHVRVWVQEAADDSVVFQRDLWREKTEDALRQLADAGVEIHRPDTAPFAAAVEPLHQRHATGVIAEWARKIKAVR
jgi:tripartite ATP-independent transporter DctP family solute receptor